MKYEVIWRNRAAVYRTATEALRAAKVGMNERRACAKRLDEGHELGFFHPEERIVRRVNETAS